MRMKCGDWNRVLQLTKDNTGYDEMIQKTQVELAQQLSEQNKWEKAAQFYKMSNHFEGMVEAYYRAEDYDALDKLINDLPEGS